MANTFKKGIDRQMWVTTPQTPNPHAAGVSFASDLRNDWSRDPFVRQLVSAAIVNRYNTATKSWTFIFNPGLGGTFGAGSCCVFAPSRGFNGTIAAGSTSTIINTSTVLSAAPALNSLSNRGGTGEYGFKIRIVSISAGKTEERYIVANSSSTTPTFVLNAALTFTPAASDLYEIIGGRFYMLNAGTIAATSFRSYEIANNILANGGTTNLPTPGTDSTIIALDEQYVPFDNNPGDGMIKGTYVYSSGTTGPPATTTLYALSATASAAATITGQAAGGDSSVLANEYRNFQIRIVEDTTTPASVGQRRIIASHTAGPSAVYSIGGGNWTTTPSASAKFVIELPNLILLRTGTNTTTYTYNYNNATINNGTNNIAADSWSTTYFAAGNANAAGGMFMPSWSIQPDTPNRYARHSFIYCFRGASTTLDLFDMSNTITGAWTSAISYDGSGQATPNTGSCNTISNGTLNEGRFSYLNIYTASIINQMYRFDVKNRVLSSFTPTEYLQAGTAAVGCRLVSYISIDGTDKYDILILCNHLANLTQELIVQV